tara:strand:- start:1372 stop:2544 length:1173 start_codon:yes stop_codon:yes gene_type:complete
MHKFKYFNNIAKEGLLTLSNNQFEIDDIKPDAILLRSHALNESEFTDSLKCIARAGAGTNNIPIDIATRRGIVVFNTPGANANAVKELVICGMLLSSRGILEGNTFIKSINYKNSQDLNKAMEDQKKTFKGNELSGKVLGIIGLGSVGSLLAQNASVMGMKIIGFDPYISIDAAWMIPKDVERAESIEYLLSNSDYISLHVPLSESTKDLIDKKTIKFIKKGANLINLSRGPIVNNLDIIEALSKQHIKTFVTDFPTLDLIGRANQYQDVILLPHLGASTREAEVNCAVMAAEQVNDFIKDGIITNSVNFPRVRLGRTTKYRLVIIHKDEPGMIGNIASEIAQKKLNITDMINKSRNDIAITLIDLEENPEDELLKKLKNIANIISIRVC